jgi:hypothetical protein
MGMGGMGGGMGFDPNAMAMMYQNMMKSVYSSSSSYLFLFLLPASLCRI